MARATTLATRSLVVSCMASLIDCRFQRFACAAYLTFLRLMYWNLTGDKTCHSTYVSCLKSIYALEMKEKAKTADKGEDYVKVDSDLTIEHYVEHSA